jgi:adenylate cyclase
MAIEIERKYLVASPAWKDGVVRSTHYREGLLAPLNYGKLRIRRAPDTAWFTIKGQKDGISRLEFEYEIPLADADQMLDKLCLRPHLEKTRHFVEHAGKTWEVDVFTGALDGLVIAEIELASADEPFEKPGWVGLEITQDPAYSSAALAEAISAGAPRYPQTTTDPA